MSDDLVKMAHLAQHDERMATGALYGDLADRIAELEAKLAKAVDALAGVDQFVRDLSPFADPSHSPALALAKACEVYAELTGGSGG